MSKFLFIFLFFSSPFLIIVKVFAMGTTPQIVDHLTSEYAGKACSTPPKGSGIIAGFFRGWEQTTLLDRESDLMPVERYRCFDTMTECEDWLKTMTYYYNRKTIDARLCTKF